jgi:hypothetical protein
MENYPHLPMARVDQAVRRPHELDCGGVRMSGADAFATNTTAHTIDTRQLSSLEIRRIVSRGKD